MPFLAFSVPVAIAISLLLAVVAISYRQVCLAYPSGGGAYAVSKANLGALASLVAAAALLIDYVMTVAVSTASAIAQTYSMVPELYDFRIEIAVVAIALITIANLRGLRESGNIFAVPTYLFVGLALAMVGIGVARMRPARRPTSSNPTRSSPGPRSVGIFLLLRAFASGSVALTGTEAIANGVPAFKPPEPRNAATTMLVDGRRCSPSCSSGSRSWPTGSGSCRPRRAARRSSRSSPRPCSATGSPLFYAFQISTALILFLAANTSFNAFPRLAALLAIDGYMPRQFAFRGDRLAFSWGIVLLAGVAAGLLVDLRRRHARPDPALLGRACSCASRCRRPAWCGTGSRERSRGWAWRAALNGVGAVLTFVVLIVVASVKFVDGAFLVVILIPLLVAMMLFIGRQYRSSAENLAVRPDFVIPPPRREERVVVPIAGLNRAVVQAVNVGRSIAADVRAVLDLRRAGGGARASAAAGSASCRTCRWWWSSRRIARSSGRSWRTSTCSTAPGRRTRRADHVRGHPRVRRAQLVGADPLQPVGEAAAHGPARPAAHGGRQRAVPARGAGARNRARRRRAERRSPGRSAKQGPQPRIRAVPRPCPSARDLAHRRHVPAAAAAFGRRPPQPSRVSATG